MTRRRLFATTGGVILGAIIAKTKPFERPTATGKQLASGGRPLSPAQHVVGEQGPEVIIRLDGRVLREHVDYRTRKRRPA